MTNQSNQTERATQTPGSDSQQSYLDRLVDQVTLSDEWREYVQDVEFEIPPFEQIEAALVGGKFETFADILNCLSPLGHWTEAQARIVIAEWLLSSTDVVANASQLRELLDLATRYLSDPCEAIRSMWLWSSFEISLRSLGGPVTPFAYEVSSECVNEEPDFSPASGFKELIRQRSPVELEALKTLLRLRLSLCTDRLQ